MKTREARLSQIKEDIEKAKTELTSSEFSFLLKQLKEFINEEEKYL